MIEDAHGELHERPADACLKCEKADDDGEDGVVEAPSMEEAGCE